MSDVPPRAQRRLEAALSLDGLTVRLHLVGDELVIAVDDPGASLDALTLLDTHSQETVLHRTGLAARTRTRTGVTRMIEVLHEAGSTSARTVAARMRPGGDIDSEAVQALSRAVALSGGAESGVGPWPGSGTPSSCSGWRTPTRSPHRSWPPASPI